MKNFFRKLIAFVLVYSCCAGCFAEAFTVTDQAGNEVSFDAPAEKIVSCYYISTASLIALGLEASFVGVEMKADTRGLYALAAPEIISLPAVGSGKGVNIEEIAALSPDVVILPRKLKDDAAALSELGLNVVIVNPESNEQFRECISLLGAVTGTSDNAEILLNTYDAITEDVINRVAGLEASSVYMASGSDFYTTYPAGIYQHDLIGIAGGTNVAGELEGDGKVTVDAEQLMLWDPEYIFIVADADYSVSDIMTDPALSELSAVKAGNVYAFPSAIEAWDYPTPSSVLGQLYMASILHPEAVTADDFMAAATEFYSNVFGIEVTAETLGITE